MGTWGVSLGMPEGQRWGGSADIIHIVLEKLVLKR